jgi:manganese/zinc/iron transport system permease protein
MSQDTIVIILVGAISGASCALLGSFLVLRRLAMLGDAISHAVLPGIALAFLFTGSRSSLPMFLGAVVIGALTAFVVQVLSERGVQGDAAIGVTFTSFFAFGVVLISLYGSQVDLDLDCVLYGEIAYAPFNTLTIAGRNLGPLALWTNGAILVVNLLVIGFFFKQFKLCAFDPEMAAAVGIPVALLHYVLMGLVAATTVGAFESVGAILVVAMLIVPAATAYLLTRRLETMIQMAILAGVISSAAGYQLARWLDCSIAGAMATVSGALFAGAFLFSPSQGLMSRIWNQHRMRLRVGEEDILLWAGRRQELALPGGFRLRDLEKGELKKDGRLSAAANRLRRSGHLSMEGGKLALTERGMHRAFALLRRHRLYESYLGELGYPTDHMHAPADRVEHFITPTITHDVEEAAHYPAQDPQGKTIPPEESGE